MSLQGTETIKVERHQQRVTVTLANPRLKNRLNSEDLADLLNLVNRLHQDTTVRVVTFTGEGDCFCAGFDLNELSRVTEDQRLPDFDKLAQSIEDLRCPTICALNGSVYGGGIDLALACDFRLGVEGMELMMPAVRLGLHYYPSGIRRYVARLGGKGARRLLLRSETVGGQDLLDLGFLDEIHPVDRLAAAARSLAVRLAGFGPLALEGMKQCINGFARSSAELATMEERFQDVLQSEDIREGIRAQREKRPPGFQRK